MCIFCGGTCGGSGDALMPLLAAGAGIAILKVRAARGARRNKDAGKSYDKQAEVESASQHSRVDS